MTYADSEAEEEWVVEDSAPECASVRKANSVRKAISRTGTGCLLLSFNFQGTAGAIHPHPPYASSNGRRAVRHAEGHANGVESVEREPVRWRRGVRARTGGGRARG